jgi:7-cyano-7-deazaguanine synthase
MKKAVVLLSGGLDSSTMLAYAREEGYDVFALSFDYGQRHRIELESARRVATSFNVRKHLVIDINLREIGGSALTAEIDVPKDRSQLREDTDVSEIPATYVPARNTIFLSFALAWAETLEAADIFIGANAIDYSGYPDCRPEFIQAFVIKKGKALNVDYSLTWSCYDPQFFNNRYTACMKCDSCLLRARGFKEAGVEDLPYRQAGE